jgi:predicted dehydrogenase
VIEGIRVGVIGAGRIGRLHIRAYERAGANVVAVADVDPEARRAAAQGDKAIYSDYEEMLAEEQLQAVSICTPPAMHSAPAIAAARRGIAVLCEKPLAHDVGAARALADAVASTGVPFMVGFFHRFHEPLVKLRELLAEGALGRPVVVRNRFSLINSVDEGARPWIADVSISGGGAMINTAVHSLDIFRFLTAANATIRGSVIASRSEVALEDTAILLLSADNGDLGIVEAYGAAPTKTYELWAEGSRGEAFVSWDPPALQLRMAGDAHWSSFPVSATDALDRIDRGIAYFCACVQEGRQPDEATGEDGVSALELATRGYQVAAGETRQS